jgi:hypothetical protein
MTEILCTLSSIKLKAQILIKTPFLNQPLTMIIKTYIAFLLTCTYFVFIFERHDQGRCHEFRNSLWLVVVTSTNLGYGDIMVGNWTSKTMLSLMSIIGIIEMALLVNYVSDFMQIPPDEKRIVGFYNKHEKLRELRISAANLIKARYKLYRRKCRVNDLFASRFTSAFAGSGKDAEQAMRKGQNTFEHQLKKARTEARNFEIKYQKTYRSWLKTKSETEAIQHQLQKGFQIDDTAIAATYISRKLEDLQEEIGNNMGTIEDHISKEKDQNERMTRLVSTFGGVGGMNMNNKIRQTMMNMNNATARTTNMSYKSNNFKPTNQSLLSTASIAQHGGMAGQLIDQNANLKTAQLERKLDSVRNKKKWFSAVSKAPRKTLFTAASKVSNVDDGNKTNFFDTLVKQMKNQRFGKETDDQTKKLEEEAHELQLELDRTLYNAMSNEDMEARTLDEANERVACLEALMLKMSENLNMLTTNMMVSGNQTQPNQQTNNAPLAFCEEDEYADEDENGNPIPTFNEIRPTLEQQQTESKPQQKERVININTHGLTEQEMEQLEKVKNKPRTTEMEQKATFMLRRRGATISAAPSAADASEDER